MNAFSVRWGVVSLLLLGAGCGTGFNRSPEVQAGPAVSSSEVVSGDEVQMHLVVTDADGDPLTYKWLQDPPAPAGAFSDISVQEPRWVAPTVDAPQHFQLKVVIMDPERVTLVGMTSILVSPK